MDEIVVRGMAKWPNVPAVYGWLSLDRRGDWRIKGERIANPGVSEFIGAMRAKVAMDFCFTHAESLLREMSCLISEKFRWPSWECPWPCSSCSWPWW